MEHVLTMANLKLKPSPFTPRPCVYREVVFPTGVGVGVCVWVGGWVGMGRGVYGSICTQVCLCVMCDGM